MEQEKINVFEVKTVLIFWYNFIFFTIIILFGFGLMVTFKPASQFNVVLVWGIAFLTGYLFAGIAKCNAKISVNENQIIVEQNDSLVKKSIDIIINLKDLRGFEVGELTTRFDTSLALYTKDFKVYRYRLNNRTDTFQLETFLSQYLPKLNAKANPEYSSFIKAFWFVLKNILKLFFFTAITWGILSYVIDLSKLKFVIIGFLLPLLFWHLITRTSLIKNNFRFAATYWLMLLFPLLSIGLLIPAKVKIEELLSEPFTIDLPKNVFAHTKEKFFYINKIRGDADKIIASYSIGKDSNKSQLITIKHSFETQVTDLNENFDNIWFRKQLTQKINKSTLEGSKANLISDFQNKSIREFKQKLTKNPTFYRVILNKHEKTPIAILEPFWEPINTYKQDVRRSLGLLTGAIILLILIGTWMITINR